MPPVPPLPGPVYANESEVSLGSSALLLATGPGDLGSDEIYRVRVLNVAGAAVSLGTSSVTVGGGIDQVVQGEDSVYTLAASETLYGIAASGGANVRLYVSRRSVGSRAATPTSGGSGGTTLARTAVKTANYTAAASDLVPVDTTGGAVTVTLPNAPANKSQVSVKQILGTAGVTVNTAGADTLNRVGGVGTMAFALLGAGADYFYDAATKVWTVEEFAAPLSQYDARYGADKLIAPSGDTTGATDAAALNAALVVGASVRGKPGGVYYINAPLVVSSNCVLNMTGCTVNQVGTQFPMIRNAAVMPTRTVTDAVATGNSTTITSATAAFTSGDVGSSFGFNGAAEGAAVWYGTILSVTNSTTAVASVNARTAVASGGTLNIFANRDSDIRIEGGSWNATDPGINGHTAGATALAQHATVFRRIDRLLIRNMVWTQPGGRGQGGRFTLSLGDVTDYEVTKIRFTAVAGDGCHIQGPATRGTVSDVGGNSGDDMVVCNAADSTSGLTYDTQGSVTGFVAERLFPIGAHNGGKLYNIESASPNLFTMSGITFRGIKGVVELIPMRVDAPNAVGVLVEDIDAAAGNGTIGTQPMVQVSNQSVNEITIRKVTWSQAQAPTNGIVNLTSPGRNVVIDDVRLTTNPTGTSIAVNLGSGSPWAMSISRVRCSPNTVSPFYAVQVGGTAAAKLSLSDIYLSSAAGKLLNVSTAAALGVNINDVHVICPTAITLPASNPASTIRVSNSVFVVTNLVSTGGPLVVELSNVDITASGPVVNVVGAAATPVRVKLASTVAQAGAGALLARDTTQALSVTGTAIPVDQTLLTPSDGDMIYNSNATPGNGAGVAIYNAAAAKWKNLYSGVTN